MRKIERQMCDAVQGNRNWKNANTEVTIDLETKVSSVYLHGNLIATVSDNDMTIYDGGWQSNTTKSRLNALCDAFCVSGEGVFQKDFNWYVRKFVGAINGQSKFVNETFDNGYIFAWCTIDLVISLNSPLVPNTFVLVIMSRSTALGMLRVGNTGEEILSILDIIVADVESEQTINEIADLLFNWLSRTNGCYPIRVISSHSLIDSLYISFVLI